MFNAYHKWLGILPKDQPPNLYRLLGVEPFESDLDVIEGAAERQMAFVRQYQSGEHAADAARILNELAAARLCLLKQESKRAYDDTLRQQVDATQFAFTTTEVVSSRKRSRNFNIQWMLVTGIALFIASVVAVCMLPPRSGNGQAPLPVSGSHEPTEGIPIESPPVVPTVAQLPEQSPAVLPLVEAPRSELSETATTDVPRADVEPSLDSSPDNSPAEPVAAENEKTRSEIPSAERQKTVARFLENTYGLSKLDGVTKKQAMAKKLMEATRDENLSADERYVMTTSVIALANEAGDGMTWREAVRALVSDYDVDARKERTRLVNEFLRTAKTAAQSKPAIEDAVELAHSLAKENRYSEATALLDTADASVRQALGADATRKMVATARETISSREKDWRAFELATRKLMADPDDATSNFAVGRWHVLEDADWKKALPFLSKAADAKWRSAATLELANSTDVAKQVEIGDAWFDLAEKESGAMNVALLVHAQEWYTDSQARLTSPLVKQHVSQRLEKITRVWTSRLPKTEIPISPPAPVVARQNEWIDLLDWSEGVDWSKRGQGVNWNANLDGPAKPQGLTIKSGWCSRFPLAAFIDGNYELEIEFTRLDGSDGVSIIFPVAMHNVHLVFGSHLGDHDKAGHINGEWSEKSPTARRPSILKGNNQRHRVLIKVEVVDQNARFSIDFDNRKDYIDWEGPISSLWNLESGSWTISNARHVWLGAMGSRTAFHKARVRMLSGTVRRDAITDADREQDLENGLIRLIGEDASNVKVGYWKFLVNQLPIELIAAGDTERLWPYVAREFHFCDDYYGAHAPSRLRSPIPPGAKSFSTVGYNDSSRSAIYKILIDNREVYDSGITDIAVAKVDIPPRSTLLELVIDPAGDKFHDHTYWCYPRYHSVPMEKISEKMIDGKTNGGRFTITGKKEVGEQAFTQNVPINTLKSAPLHFRSAQPCDEFLWAHAPSTATYQVPPGMTRFSAIGYCTASHHVVFELLADGKVIHRSAQAGIVPIDVKLPQGTKTIELRVDPLGDQNQDLSVWCYPRLHRK